jgi:phosphatidylglycerol---prolipoprotein diacylglyceryl transferase
MWPNIGPIKTYGVLYLIGIVLHFVLGRRIARRYGLQHRVWIAAGICYMLGMLVGAKVLFDLRQGTLSLSALLQADHWLQGGLWGGLLAYFPMAIPAVLLLSRRRLAALDLVALTVPIPWIAAKLGCFFNGCCYGRPCSLPWAVTFPQGARGTPAGVPLHPTQLYEVAIMLVLLLVFSQLKSDRWRGTKWLWFFVIYGFGRAATDFLRGDTEGPLYLDLLSLTQLLSAASAAVALLLLGLHLHGMNCRARLAQDGCT